MSEKIDGLPAPLPRLGTRTQAEKEPAVAAPVRPSADDSVSLTSTAKALAGMEEILAEVPEVDRERVAALRQAIADGTYSVDAEQVAEKLLRMEETLKSED